MRVRFCEDYQLNFPKLVNHPGTGELANLGSSGTCADAPAGSGVKQQTYATVVKQTPVTAKMLENKERYTLPQGEGGQRNPPISLLDHEEDDELYAIGDDIRFWSRGARH